MLSIQDVGFRYGNRQVLKNINIQLQKGAERMHIGSGLWNMIRRFSLPGPAINFSLLHK